MTTVCVQNTHSWFEAREASNNYLWTGANTKGEFPSKRPAIELLLTLNKDGKLDALQFTDMEKIEVTYDGNSSVIYFDSVEKIVEFLERLFSFTGTSTCLVSPDLDLNRVRDLLYNLEIRLYDLDLEESGTVEEGSTEKKWKSVCMVHVITCGCNMGHCGAVHGWQKVGPFKTIREIFSGFDCGESDSELLDEFCNGFFKPEEKDVEKRFRYSFLYRDQSMLSEEEQWIYRRMEIFVEAKMKERWFEYPDSVFLYLRPLEKIPTLDPPCYGVHNPKIPTDELDIKNEVYIRFCYSR